MLLVVLLVFANAVYSPVLAQANNICQTGYSWSYGLNVIGPIGSQGLQGIQGNAGLDGSPGEKGQTGVRGEKGRTGPKGLEGNKGSAGLQGAPGIRGIIGDAGPPGEKGGRGSDGTPGQVGAIGPHGSIGPQGPPGLQGVVGAKGEPTDAVLSTTEFEQLRRDVHLSVMAEINATLESLQADGQQAGHIVQVLNARGNRRLRTLCCVHSIWRKVGSFDTRNGDVCPSQLRTVTNQDNTKTACGRSGFSSTAGCSSVSIPVGEIYTQVCGIVRGYQYASPDAFDSSFDGTSIDSDYVDGISITHGSPRRHLWTYANGLAETNEGAQYRCPCSTSPLDESRVPSFVGQNYYCEAAYPSSGWTSEVVWHDPLWDGEGCQSTTNQCCQRSGWFHREIQASSDNIELRICGDQDTSDEDTLLERYEFWVL